MLTKCILFLERLENIQKHIRNIEELPLSGINPHYPSLDVFVEIDTILMAPHNLIKNHRNKKLPKIVLHQKKSY